MPRTAIVILTWNGIEFLKQFLGLAIENSQSAGTFLVVADNGSTDGSAEWTRKNFPSVTLITLDKNHGFAGGYNLALQQIDADYFILLNSDIEVTPGWTEPLIKFMNDNADAASCQPKILSWHRREFFEHAGAAGGFLDKFGYPFCRGRVFNKIEQDSGQYDTDRDVFWSSGACMIVRADAWKKCSGFDPSFFAHMEEIDLCWRFHKMGYRVCFIHESVVYHIGGGALPYHSPFKTYLNFRNSLYLLYKNLPRDSFRRTLFIRRLLDGLAAMLFLVTGKFRHIRSVWKAHMDYYKKIPDLRVKREEVKKLTITDSSFPVLNKSIVFEFYVKGNKTFGQLGTKL